MSLAPLILLQPMSLTRYAACKLPRSVQLEAMLLHKHIQRHRTSAAERCRGGELEC